jgi:hypothetical protein
MPSVCQGVIDGPRVLPHFTVANSTRQGFRACREKGGRRRLIRFKDRLALMSRQLIKLLIHYITIGGGGGDNNTGANGYKLPFPQHLFLLLTHSPPTYTLPTLTLHSHLHIMSAPGYKASMDGTTVNNTDGTSSYPPTNNGKGSSPIRSNGEEDLHRYVTDDAPRSQRPLPKAEGNGLIVSETVDSYGEPH